MPAKRRSAKRRLDPQAECALWAVMFKTSDDYFNELTDIGFESEAAARAAAPDAWRRLGAIYLDQHADPSCPCWALEQFGMP